VGRTAIAGANTGAGWVGAGSVVKRHREIRVVLRLKVPAALPGSDARDHPVIDRSRDDFVLPVIQGPIVVGIRRVKDIGTIGRRYAVVAAQGERTFIEVGA